MVTFLVFILVVAAFICGLCFRFNSKYENLYQELLLERCRFESAVANSVIGVGFVSKEGKWLSLNKCLSEMLLYSEEELLNMTFMDHTYEDDLAPDLALFEDLISGEIDSYQMLKRYVRKDGSIFPIELTVTAVKDSDGNFLHTVSQIVDITEIREQEKSLTNKTVHLDLSLRAAQVGTWRWDLTNDEVEWDDYMYQIFGRQKDNFNDDYSSFSDFVISEDFENLSRELQKSIRDNKKLDTQFRIRREDGSVRTIAAIGETEYDEDGCPLVMRGVNFDITDKIEQQRLLEIKREELERSNQELAQFAYITSHDLKAPLRGISSLSTWIDEELSDVDKTEELETYLRLLNNRTKRMENLIDGILEYSRVGRKEIEKDLVDLNQIVFDLSEDLTTNNEWHIVLCELPEIRINETRIKQIFLNLFQNAIKHGEREDGVIQLTYEDLGDEHKFSIKDNGPGIEPKYHEKIFQIFQTLKPKDEMESTGIGLTLVRKIVRDYGGEAGVDSKLGEGAEFWFTFSKEATQ